MAAGKAIPLLLLVLLTAAAAAGPTDDGLAPGEDGVKERHEGVETPWKFNSESNIAIDTTKIDVDLLNKMESERLKTAKSIIRFQFNEKRVQHLSRIKLPPSWTRGIIYWMNRDQRVQDNWAMLYAQKLAFKMSVPLHVVFFTPTAAPINTLRQYEFMIQGLKEVQRDLQRLSIPFHLLRGNATEILSDYVKNHDIGAIVVDFMPLREYMRKTEELGLMLSHRVPVTMVDAHNVLPTWTAAMKLAKSPPRIYTDIDGELRKYLTEFPLVAKHPFTDTDLTPEPIDWQEADKNVEIDRSVLPVPNFKGGYKSGILELENFMKYRLQNYSRDSMDPMKDGLSNLSPWLHFGQISAHRAILEVREFAKKYSLDDKRFLYEIVMRRELSDLYCLRHRTTYDSINGARYWARRALHMRSNDTRDYVYTRDEFEEARTHDDLWNASQMQMVTEGKMHRFMRAYWAKKILEWSDAPASALATAIYLNDKYSLDGNDPNSYNGCMWAVCGVHDRPWKKRLERPVFGPIRYVKLAWYEATFDTVAYVKKYLRR